MEQEMKYIYTVYRTGSFSEAAKELFLTQPALSIAVSKAEARIGMPLFDRSRRPLALTAAGEAYIEKYEAIRALEKDLEMQLNDLSGLKTGALRIGGSHYIISHILPPYLASFSEKYPGISLELAEAGADSLLAMLSDHAIDLTFNCEEDPEERFLRIPCFTDHILLAVPGSLAIPEQPASAALTGSDILAGRHLRRDCPTVSVSHFADLPFVILTPGNGLHDRALEVFAEADISPKIRLMAGQLTTCFHLCEAGLGASFVPDRLVKRADAGMLFFRIDSPHTVRHFDLVLPKNRYISNAVKAFTSHMTDVAPSPHPLIEAE